MRGSAFAFRKVVDAMWLKRIFGASFAASSVLTPFFLGAVAGGVATGRVPPGNARGNLITSWLNPTSLLGGTLAVGVCAYLPPSSWSATPNGTAIASWSSSSAPGRWAPGLRSGSSRWAASSCSGPTLPGCSTG